MNASMIAVYKKKNAFILKGNYRNLIYKTAFDSGVSYYIKKIFLFITLLGFKKQLDDTAFSHEIKTNIDRYFADYILLKTDWYKNAFACGLAKSDKIYFIKLFKDMHDVEDICQKTAHVQKYFDGFFITIPIVKTEGRLVIYPYIERKRGLNANDHFANKIIEYNQNAVIQNNTKKAHDFLPLDLFITVHDLAMETTIRKAYEWISSKNIELPFVPVHGDMTPWNIFIDKDEKIVLVDYEEAGWHCIYYDYFHFILQKSALKERYKTLQSLIDKRIWSHKENRYACIVYLVDQLYKHATDIKRYGASNPHLNKIIQRKLAWITEITGNDHVE